MTLLTIAPTAKSASLSDRVREAPLKGVLKHEVVVVGTGAGGAVAGTELAKAGHDVLFLEAGGAYTQRDFQRGSLIWTATRVFQGRGLQGATTSTPPMIVPSGRVVGGSTVLNSAICFRPPDERLLEWAAAVGDDRLRPEALAPFIDEIWRRIGVTTTHEGIGRRNNALLRDGLARIGARHAWMDRNAPGCIGCGMCHLGCPSGGKASVDKSILPEALNHGASVLTRARVEGVIVEGGRARGVDVVVIDEVDERPKGRVRVEADLVIIAGSAFGSPLVLQASGVGGPERGRHLALHPGLYVIGEFDDPVVMWDGVPQGYYAHDDGDDRALIESANVGVAELFALFGRAGAEGAREALRFHRWGMAGTMIRDVGAGTVALDEDGFRPAIAYQLQDRDLQAFRAGTKTLIRAWFAAGAKRVCPGVAPMRFYDREQDALDAVDGLRDPAQVAQPYASHPHGTCRMGPAAGPHRGVVDPDGKVHGVAGLYVMDGSIFPSTLGVNPQVTIMALALALARRLATKAAPD